MTAIQRWYWMPGMAAGDHDLGPMPDGAKQWNGDPVPLSEQWCKAKDVAELERVIAEQGRTLSGLRADRLKAINEAGLLRDRVQRLEGELMSISQDDGKVERALESAQERIRSLEHIAMGMQSDAKVTAENYVILQARHTSLQHRYDLLMQRTKPKRGVFPVKQP